LDAVVQVDAVFSHGGFVWMLQTDVALVLLDPGLDRTASLPDVDLTTLTGHAVHTISLESQVILHRPKETRGLLQGLWVDSPSDLSVALTVLPESGP
jgi:hypothetical protein